MRKNVAKLEEFFYMEDSALMAGTEFLNILIY